MRCTSLRYLYLAAVPAFALTTSTLRVKLLKDHKGVDRHLNTLQNLQPREGTTRERIREPMKSRAAWSR